jgi:hypothetical protein
MAAAMKLTRNGFEHDGIIVTISIDVRPLLKAIDQMTTALNAMAEIAANAGRLLELSWGNVDVVDLLKADLSPAGRVIYWFRTWLAEPPLDVLADLEDFPLAWDLGWRPER